MTDNTLSSRQKQALQTREKIYESAEELFIENDFESVTVDQIVKKAGVAKGSFYVHFASKDEVIVLLINDYVEKVDTDYKSFLDSLAEDMPADEKFLALVEKIAEVLTENIGKENMRLLYRVQLEKKLNVSSVISYDRDLYKMFLQVIEEDFESLAPHSSLSAENVARQFVTVYRGLVFDWCVRTRELDLKTEALDLYEMLLKGLNE
ncbi:MAG: TetR/AcrR family transcriptional regulator [Eubacteriales bacterium]|nr:TetR/AcrR family transcriptional regulator [Eubacteriales bacterium]